MKLTKTRLVLCLMIISLSLRALAYEEPSYEVIASVDGVEYRQYEAYLVAETVVAADTDRDRAANTGFRRLFGYITGENVAQASIDMTTPVEQQPVGRKIEMTTPVQQSPGTDGWTVAFVVPREYTSETVPQPSDPKVYIREVPAELRAVLRYSGRWTDKNVKQHKDELISRLAMVRIQPKGEVMTAFYNAPFSLPFMRRNEVMVVVDEVPSNRQLVAD